MRKRLLQFLAIILIAFATSGCIKHSTTIEITKNSKASIAHIDALDKEMLKALDENYDSEKPFESLNRKEFKSKEERYKQNRFEVRNYEDDNYIGREFRKKYKKADFIPAEDLPTGIVLDDNTPMVVNMKRGVFGIECNIHLKFDPSKIKTEIEQQKKVFNDIFNDDGDYSPNSIADLTIKIPYQAYENNATKVNEETHEYTWIFSDMEEVKQNKSVDIILKYKKTNYISIVLVIIILISTILAVIKNKKYSEKQTDENLGAF